MTYSTERSGWCIWETRQFEARAVGCRSTSVSECGGEEHWLQSWLCNQAAIDLSVLICMMGPLAALTSVGCSEV